MISIIKQKKKNLAVGLICGSIIAVCGVTIALCLNLMNDEQKAIDNEILKNETLKEKAIVTESDSDKESEDGWTDPMNRIVDFDYLHSVNSDISSWIYLPNPYVDLPVLQEQTVGQSYYINHDYTGAYSFNGSILTPAIPKDMDDAHRLIFGHNIDSSGIFFSALPDTFCYSDFADENPYVYMYYPDRTERWTISTSCHIYSSHSVYNVPYEIGSDRYQNMIDDVYYNANYIKGEKPDKNDELLVLSTCRGYQGDSKRFIVTYTLDKTKYLSNYKPEKATEATEEVTTENDEIEVNRVEVN